MKELLIIFVILLVLLMLISTFGGSIRPKETFYQVVQEEAIEPVFKMPNLPQPPMTPLPSAPSFDMPSQIPKFDLSKSPSSLAKNDLSKPNVEPFQQHALYGAPI